jgi:hypothetical protein
MMLRHASAVVAAVLAAIVLSGCFVLSKSLPAGQQVIDQRLVGAWGGIDKDDPNDIEAFLHFLKPEGEGPLKLVWVENNNYQVYEVNTFVIGGKNVFAAKLLTPFKDDDDVVIPEGYFLGFYEFNGDDEIAFTLLEADKIGELIKAGKLKGEPGKGKYDFAMLTGSPAELARFLASPEAQAARLEDPAYMRRIPGSRKSKAE